jgi:hypothetical protein
LVLPVHFSPPSTLLRRSRIGRSLIPAVLAVFSASLGLQVAAIATTPRAQNGYDVGEECYQLGYGGVGNETNFDTCATGGCRTLHASTDTAGMALCMEKARLARNDMREIDGDVTSEPEEDAPTPADPGE